MYYSIMVAAMRYNEADGISKKISLQAAAFSAKGNISSLICIGNQSIIKITYNNGCLVKKDIIASLDFIDEYPLSIKAEYKTINKLLYVLKNEILINTPHYLYIRHMIPQLRLLSVLSLAKRKGIKIGYEIPTYPYYSEQINISHNKIKTFVKLVYESIYWPLIYFNINKLFAICCSTEAHIFKKMKIINNGYSGNKNIYIKRNTNDLIMIGVGTIYPYHGYNRIIDSMRACNYQLKTGGKIYFHIVGSSNEIDRLKSTLSTEDKNHILFHGVLYGNELKSLYYESNLGIGTMALSIRKANIDTAIKNIEYLSFYLPIISSGRVFNLPSNSKYCLSINEKSDIDFNKIAQFAISFYSNDEIVDEIDNILNDFDWTNIISNVMLCLKNA